MGRCPARYGWALAACAVFTGCNALTGVGDLRTDEPDPGAATMTREDAATPPGLDGGSTGDDDATAPDAAAAAARSTIEAAGTGAPVGGTIVVTLTTRDANGTRIGRGGDVVTFGTTGGSSVFSIGAVSDAKDGTYVAIFTGATEGSSVTVTATVNGAPVTTTGPAIRVVNPVTAGATLWLDAANADGAGNAGAKACPGAGPATWTDLSPSGFSGTLTGFASIPCSAASGWAGDGTTANPHRLSFDGTDDHVRFGVVNSLNRQTIVAWIRQRAGGTAANTSGTGNGLNGSYPIVAKGASDATSGADLNYHLGIDTGGRVGHDFESPPAEDNNPLLGATTLVPGPWRMIAVTFDFAPASRTIHVDGKADKTAATSTPPLAGTASQLVVGGANKSNGTAAGRFSGDVAVVLTYDRALSQAEIEQNCHAFSSRFGMLSCPN